QLVTPNAATPVEPGRRTLTVSRGGREVQSLIVHVSPGAVATINVPTKHPAPGRAPAHGAKICDPSLNCISR
ncbi:MAG TPA: hypothetical protein VFS00_09635, partial [Polyangiaceae bacterium]|nr:hypothetical protein [Polyangiaceae bacterium]